ncbi:unnamed protein product [Notodromas monacha]|uniref:DENN domain-containing protein 5A n=1 Tax=Notodromas monacha TaxID=399045 RepID=A0A7R9GCF5_9CRUS|nr:unnamed protein product [Notodromas monacha]CAG0915928.1 unnamed protein product [Notodromas monacha]
MTVQCNRFIDYFVICGLDGSSGLEVAPTLASDDEVVQENSPLERSYKSKILGHYPDTVPWNQFDPEAVSTLCMPHGLEFRTQKHKLDPYFHGFIVTREDGSRYYGFAFTFYEEVKDSKICTALHTLQSMHIAEASRGTKPSPGAEKKCPPYPALLGNTKSLPRHFRLSDLADPASSETNKYYDIGKDDLFCLKTIAVISQYPFLHLAKELLSGLYRLVMRDVTDNLCIEDYVYNALYGIPLPNPGTSVGVRLWGPGSPLLCLQLPDLDELPLLEFPFRIVFSLLPPQPLLQLFACVLLESQVLLFSRDFNRLFLIAECISALLFPFSWEHVYVPIVPASLMHFLDAPVPYIMGLQCSKKSRQGLDFGQASLCVVDIDKGKVKVPEDTPCFPRDDDLIKEITVVLEQFGLKEPYDKNRNEKLIRRHSSRRRKTSWSNDSDSGLSSDRSHSPISARHQSSSASVASVLASPRNARGSRIAAGLQNQRRRQRRAASADANGEDAEDDDWSYGANGLPPSGSIFRQTGMSKKGQTSFESGPGCGPGNPTTSQYNIRDAQYASDILLNNGVREVFLNRFIHMFGSFENFVILPTQDLESWLNNRDSVQNFDKSTYLGDQPAQHWPFLSRFLETQMFTSFVDAKILKHFGQSSPRVDLFEQRILRLRAGRNSCEQNFGDGTYLPCESIQETQEVMEPRLKSADVLASAPSSCLVRGYSAPIRQGPLAHFPLLDPLVMNQPLSPRALQKLRYPGTRSRPRLDKPNIQSPDMVASRRLSTINDVSKAVLADKNWTFVEELLKGISALWFHLHNFQQLEDPIQGIDPNQLTPEKLIVPLRRYPRLAFPQILMQLKRGNVGLLADQLRNLDLTTSGLTDSLKSATGTLARGDLGANFRSNNTARSVFPGQQISGRSPSVPPPMNRLSRFERNASVERSGGFSRSRGTSPDVSSVSSFRPMPKSVTFDMSHVQAMEEIKTEVGYARAWVRLALEKKLLSTHLRSLLSNYDLLRTHYKRCAFLRCDDEREQFLYHLLSLNAVDFFCFTNTYTKMVISYQVSYEVLVVPSKKQSSTSANVWVSVTGTLGETKPIELPRGLTHVVFEHKNLGVLSSLTIGHDNSGMYPNWHVDHVLVRNEVTGHTYVFSCGRWLGKNVDDGSTARLLVGELMRAAVGDELQMSMTGSMYGSLTGLSSSASISDSMYARASPANSSRPQSPAVSRRFTDSRLVEDIQEMLRDAVNVLVKHFNKKEADRGSLTQLLCGDGGLVMAFERTLLCGFKSSRLFSRNLYLWDYLVRVQAHHVAIAQRDRAEGKKQTDVMLYKLIKSYCILIDRINKAPPLDEDQKFRISSSLGKDDKFQLFVCISVRDHLLSWFLDLLAKASPTAQMFEDWSFLRTPELLSFMKCVLGALDEFNMVLETSVSKGISASMYKCFQTSTSASSGNQGIDGQRGRDRRRIAQR